MPNFAATLVFKDATQNEIPQMTDLLFYEATSKKLARGWVAENGQLILVGSNFKPTHFAEHCYPIERAEAVVSKLAEQASKPPTRCAFGAYNGRYLVVERNSVTHRSEIVASSNRSELFARESWANWSLNPNENCWYELVENTEHKPIVY
jgi:hypothetical protein